MVDCSWNGILRNQIFKAYFSLEGYFQKDFCSFTTRKVPSESHGCCLGYYGIQQLENIPELTIFSMQMNIAIFVVDRRDEKVKDNLGP